MIQSLGFIDSFDISMILILRFVDSSNVCATVMMDSLEDSSEGCDLQSSFADNINVLIGLSCGSFFWVLSLSLFGVLHVIHCPNLISEVSC